MSENRNRDYSEYDAMTTEALEEILRLDASAPEGEESDTELLLYVMGVLAKRKKNNSTGKTALESWESFQRNYLPQEEDLPEAVQVHASGRTAAPWLRRLIAAAAVIVLVVCIPVSAQAFGWEDIWNIFARWAKETFSFVSGESADVTEPDTAHRGGTASLQELLADSQRDAGIVPTWIPEGFVLERIEKDIMPTQEVYRARYTDGDKNLEIQIKNHLPADVYNFEVEEDVQGIYTAAGIEYYLLKNVDQRHAVWVIDSYECNISGDVSLDEMKMMIDSIGKG